jgi:hypothetical protein
VVAACRASINRWEASAPIGWCVRRLSMAVVHLPRKLLKYRATLYTVGWRVSVSMTWQSFGDNFSLSPFFLSPPSQKVFGIAKLQGDPLSFNCIEFDFIFNSIYWHLFFMFFFNQIRSSFFLFLFILLLIFFLNGFYFWF